MRTFPYITLGKIREMLLARGIKIPRLRYIQYEKENKVQSKRTAGGWRVYNTDEANRIVQIIETAENKRKEIHDLKRIQTEADIKDLL